MTTFQEVGQATYMALETFRKNGKGVNTPVWVAGENGRLYVWTLGDSYKVKRIQNNSQVRIAKSDARGNPESEWLAGEAQVHQEKTAVEAMKKRLAKKYGLLFRVFQLLGVLRGQRHSYVVLEIEPATS